MSNQRPGKVVRAADPTMKDMKSDSAEERFEYKEQGHGGIVKNDEEDINAKSIILKVSFLLFIICHELLLNFYFIFFFYYYSFHLLVFGKMKEMKRMK